MSEPAIDLRIQRLALRLKWRSTPGGRRAGRTRSRRLGTSGEFEGYRPFAVGDEVRRIDPKIWARLRQRVVRVYREDSAVPVTLLLDRSASMQPDSSSRSSGRDREVAVAEIVTLFAQLSRRSGDACRAFRFAEGRLAPWSLPRSLTVANVEAALGAQPCAGPSDYRAAFRKLPPDPAGRGYVVVVSDAFGLVDPARELAPLARIGVPYWFAPLEPSEWDPSPTGATRFVSREGEPSWRGQVDGSTVRAYRLALARYHDGMRRHLHAFGGAFVAVSSDDRIETIVERTRREGEWLA